MGKRDLLYESHTDCGHSAAQGGNHDRFDLFYSYSRSLYWSLLLIQIVAIGPHKEGTMIDWIALQDICSVTSGLGAVTSGLRADIKQFGVCVCKDRQREREL